MVTFILILPFEIVMVESDAPGKSTTLINNIIVHHA